MHKNTEHKKKIYAKNRFLQASGLLLAGVFLHATPALAHNHSHAAPVYSIPSHSAQGWYLNPGLGYQWHDGDRDLKSMPLFGLGLEYRINEYFAAELSYWRGKADRERLFITIDPWEVDYDTLRLDGLYYLQDWRWGSLTPYWVGGIGYGRFENNEGTSLGQGWQIHTGPGLSLDLHPRWRLQTDVRPTFNRDGSYWDVAARLALSFRLSGQAAQEAPPSAASYYAPLIEEVAEPVVEAPVAPEPVWVTQVLTHEFSTHFDTMSHSITEVYKRQLNEAANFMLRYPESRAIVSGHTDNRGSLAVNERLSSQRAQVVAQHLAQTYSIDPERFEIRNYGFSQPIGDNTTEEGRALNRRTEVTIRVEVQVQQ